MGVPRRLHHGHEEVLLLRPGGGPQQVVLDRVRVAKVLRRLYQSHSVPVEQETQRAVEKIPFQTEIGVDDEQEFALGARQGVVQVAGLAVLIRRAREVADAAKAAQFPQPGPPAVVQDPDLHPSRRVVQRQRRPNCRFQDLHPLVVGGYEDVHGRQIRLEPEAAFMGVRLRRMVGDAGQRPEAPKLVRRDDHFAAEKRPGPQGRRRPDEVRQCAAAAPDGVDQGEGGHDQDHRPTRPGAAPALPGRTRPSPPSARG